MAQAPLIPFDYLERQKRRTSQQGEVENPIARAMGVLQTEQARSTIIQAPDPDTTAKVTRAARQTGEPPALIEDRLGDIEKAQRAEKMGALLDMFPVYRLWAQENPRGVVAASDDHKALGILGGAWDWAKKIGPRLGAGTYEGGAGLRAVTDRIANVGAYANALVQAPIQTVLDAAGINRGYDPFKQADKFVASNDAGRAAMRAEGGRLRQGARSSSWLGDTALAGFESIPLTFAAMITRNPTLAYSVPAASVGGNAYDEGVAKGLRPVDAFRYAIEQGGIEAATEKLPAAELLKAIENKTGFGRALVVQLGTELPQEQVATVLQDFSEWAVLNPDKPFSSYIAARPEAALATLVQTAVGTTVQTAAVKAAAATVEAGGKVAGRVAKAREAKEAETFFDQIERAAVESKLRQRDPEAYAELIAKTANESGVSQVFVPAEAIRAYQQSDSYDQFDDPFADYQAQIDEADAVGGDVVLPASFALGTLPGTAAWAAVKADLRLAPGGMSSREAESLQAELDDVMAELTDQAMTRDREQQGERDARGQIVERVTARLQNAGFTPANAAMQAELIAQREATRASRMGRELTGNEFTTKVTQVLPPSLGEIVKADQLDLVVNALRKGGPAVRQRGKSLLEWIVARGGIEDRGGDIASMGGDKWHKGKVGKRKLLKSFDAAQGNMMGGATSDNSVERLLDAAISEGFFPDLLARRESGESIDNNVLLEAIGQELSGSPLYSQEAVTDNVRAAADDLAAMLAERGLTASEMTDEEIRAAVAQMGSEGSAGVVYDQLPESIDIDGVARPTRNSEGMPLAGSEEGLRAFWKWFAPGLGSLRKSLSDDVIDSLKRDTEFLADFLVGEAGQPQSDGSFVIPSDVFGHVVNAVSDQKVLDAVIRSLPIDVVDLFARKQVSPKMAFHDSAVLEDVFSVDPESGVTLPVDPSVLAALTVRIVANAGAKITGLTGGAFKANAAILADANDPIFGAHVRKSPNQNLNIVDGFGDSKVVDEEGRPLVVYHGTGAEIEAFNGVTWASVGTDLANEYAAMREIRGQGVATVMPLYMRAERIFDADAGLSKSETVGSFFNNALEQTIEQGREVDLERARALLETIRAASKREESGPRYDRHDFWYQPIELFGQDGAEAIREMFDLMGFDGIKMRENGSDTFGAFSPTQIKSINNRGTFDPADARILYQSAETLEEVRVFGESLGLSVSLSRRSGEVEVNMLKSSEQGSGAGTAFMERLAAWSDATGTRIVLTPEKVGNTSVARLKGFYKRFGFVENKGKSRDFSTRAAMIRVPRAFYQSLNEGPRGRILMEQNQPFRIELFQARNLSTLLHELSHQWLEELRADAESPDAPEQVKADWQAAQDWFAANGHAVTDGVIPVEAHEMWARGGERYLMEGKSPSSALTRLFETFRGWLLNIYKTVDALRAPITPEIREVFDRLLASDEEIAAMAEMQMLQPMFKDAAAIGMTGQEFDAYTAQAQAARDQANASLLAKTMAAIRRRETKKFRDEKRGVMADEAERLDDEPLLKSIRLMRETPIDQEWLVDRMGQDVLGLLPKRVPPLWREGGINPDSLAELAGFGSGQQMIEVLIGAERQHRQAREGGDQRTMRARMIENAADAEMTRRYGDDPLNDGSIEQEAIAAVNGELQGELLASEVRLLSRRTGQRPTPYKIARQWARNRVRTGIVSVEASPGAIQRHARNVAKAGRDAEKAMTAGKMDEALRFKQQQMLSSALLAEAKAAYDEVQTAVKRMGKIAKRATMKSVDQDYLEQAHALLEAVDLKERTQKSIERQGRWEAWSAAREAEGYEVVVPPSFEATINRTNWSRLPVETLLGLDEAVAQVMHLGRLKQSLLDKQEQREWDEIFGEAENAGRNIDGPPPKDMTDPGWWDALKGRVIGADASLLKMETVFDWLDGGDPNGVFNRIAFRPIAEAQAREQDMLKDYYGRIKALFEAVPADVAARWQDKLELPFTDVLTGQPMRMNRHKVIAMALNVGNEGNLQRLADGYQINPGALTEYLNATLTAEEWQFVQGVWDTIDTLWPEISRIEREVNGVAPDKVEAREVQTPFGTLRGGYYPAVYDSTRDYKAEENRGREADLFEGGYTRATTRASSTKERAEAVKRPILLDLGIINRHLGEVIHDITHREAVIRANRFLTNERVMRTVDEALGPEIRKQFRPWLKFVANSWAIERAGNEGFGKFIGQLRANATVVGMGLRATTMVTQIAGYSNSVEVVGEAAMAKALARFSANPASAIRWVMESSDEVRNRMDTLDRDIRTELARLNAVTVTSKAMRAVIDSKKFVFHGIGYMDRLVSVPTWIAGYNNALAAGMDEQDARYAGDKAVRQSQGAGGPKDLAAIQRGTGKWGEALKLFTMFYSYFSAQYQRERTLGRDIAGNDQRRSRSAPKLAARAFFLLALPPLLVEVLRAAVGAKAGPDDEEWWAQWTMRKLLANALGPIPVVRDLFEPTWNAIAGNKVFNPSISPLQRAMDSVVKVGRDVGKLVEGEETKSATKDVLEMVGYSTGLVPGQVASATQFLVDVSSGDADPQGFGDWLQGLSTGKIQED